MTRLVAAKRLEVLERARELHRFAEQLDEVRIATRRRAASGRVPP